MVQIVSPRDVRADDIIEIAASPDFQRRGSPTTLGIVREIVTDPNDPQTVNRLVVFEMLPDDGKLRSRFQYVTLNSDNLRAYGAGHHVKWVAVIDPVAVDVDADNYFVRRKGHLRSDDAGAILQKIYEMGGDDHIRMGGTGPIGYAQADWNKIVAPGFERRLGNPDDDKGVWKPRKPRIISRGAEATNQGRVIDLPLAFAARVTDLSPTIIDALRAKGIETLRRAWELTALPQVFSAYFPAKPDILPDISIDDAIDKGYLDADTRGLGFATDPIGQSKPVETLGQLYALTLNDGAGFKAYMGLASKTAKVRIELSAAAQAAWAAYSTAMPSASDAAAQIRREWGKLLSDYAVSVRPHLNDSDLSRMDSPEKIPEKYIHNGKLVFTFPALKK